MLISLVMPLNTGNTETVLYKYLWFLVCLGIVESHQGFPCRRFFPFLQGLFFFLVDFPFRTLWDFFPPIQGEGLAGCWFGFNSCLIFCIAFVLFIWVGCYPSILTHKILGSYLMLPLRIEGVSNIWLHQISFSSNHRRGTTVDIPNLNKTIQKFRMAYLSGNYLVLML